MENIMLTKIRRDCSGRGLLSLLLTVVIIAMGLMYYLKSEQGNPSRSEKAIEQAEDAAGVANRATLTLAIEQYRINNGNYPSSLAELVKSGFIVAAACKDSAGNWLKYDPATGKILP